MFGGVMRGLGGLRNAMQGRPMQSAMGAMRGYQNPSQGFGNFMRPMMPNNENPPIKQAVNTAAPIPIRGMGSPWMGNPYQNTPIKISPFENTPIKFPPIEGVPLNPKPTRMPPLLEY